MLRAAMSSTGAKLDSWLGAGFVATGTMAPDSFLQAYGSALMIAGGLILIAIRIAIAIKTLLKE